MISTLHLGNKDQSKYFNAMLLGRKGTLEFKLKVLDFNNLLFYLNLCDLK